MSGCRRYGAAGIEWWCEMDVMMFWEVELPDVIEDHADVVGGEDMGPRSACKRRVYDQLLKVLAVSE